MDHDLPKNPEFASVMEFEAKWIHEGAARPSLIQIGRRGIRGVPLHQRKNGPPEETILTWADLDSITKTTHFLYGEFRLNLKRGNPIRIHFAEPETCDKTFESISSTFDGEAHFEDIPESPFAQLLVPAGLATMCVALGVGIHLYFRYLDEEGESAGVPGLFMLLYNVVGATGVLFVFMGLALIFVLWGAARYVKASARE